MGREDSVSPVRGRGSPRRSPSRREKSPVRHRSSRKENMSLEEKPYSRKKSPKHTRSRSPVHHSPVREKTSSRARSPKRRKSLSPVSRSPEKGKPSSRGRSPKRTKSRSPERRSPSPRTKRLRRLQAEREAEKMSAREADEGNHGRRGERGSHRERESDREVPSERKEKRSRRDGVDDGNSRGRRSTSPSDHNRRSGRHRSRSPSATDNRAHDEVNNSRGSEDRNGDEDSIAKMKAAEEALDKKDKQKPSFELSGKLAAETNRVRGVTLLFTEPAEARKPDVRWRLYVFKGGEVLNEPLYIHRQSCYLFGRERRVADVPTDHPSCSKQHAVLQYRQVEKENADGTSSKIVKPYLMDLGSTNGTFINDNKMDPERYYELCEGDTVKFGNSSREYVLLHEKSAG